ncbi:MAG: hypothetical protein HUK22_04080, partial [Thermoguttaceae bacterium]|nr:hypothetical protein [Thermoguttaceae bacterium]
IALVACGLLAEAANNDGWYYPFATGDLALDSERGRYDDTVGDLDDILAFTARAKEGRLFRGRFLEPVYNADGSVAAIKPTVVESQYAEIIWFVRGTTLYRRVLPIVSNEKLQASFQAIADLGGYEGSSAANLRTGFGFYRFYDVSVHAGPDGVLVANTLGDLSDRANRYFYWNTIAKNGYPDGFPTAAGAPVFKPFRMSPHGDHGAWYWLRMPTLQESARLDFCAGSPFGRITNVAQNGAFVYMPSSWPGAEQKLSWTNAADQPLDAELSPQKDAPFIDYWNNANIWNEVDRETGDLTGSVGRDVVGNELIFNQDVVLTNVVAFNVTAWNPASNEYVDLG